MIIDNQRLRRREPPKLWTLTDSHARLEYEIPCAVNWLLSVSFKGLEKKREDQRRLHEENMHINVETIQARERRREEEKLMDTIDVEYMQKKLVRWRANHLQRQTQDHAGQLKCLMTSAGVGGGIWSRAEKNQEGEGAGDCQAEVSAAKSKRLQSRAGLGKSSWTPAWYIPHFNPVPLKMWYVCVLFEGWAPCTEAPGECGQRMEEEGERDSCKESAGGSEAEGGSLGAGPL